MCIRKVQENQAGLKLNGTPLLLVYADYMNLLGDNIQIDSVKESTEILIGLEVKAEKLSDSIAAIQNV
jgi:hypothetical protein